MKENYLAIGLGKVDTGETDRVYTFYTREKGLLRVGAKGIRKPQARLAPHVEDFVLSHITIAQNFGPGTLAGAVTEDGFMYLRDNLDTMFVLMYVRDLFLKVVGGSEIDTRAFDLYVSFLKTAHAYRQQHPERGIGFLGDAFLMKLYGILGYIFYLQQCALCKTSITRNVHFFDVNSGGIICATCASDKTQALRIDVHTITFLRLIKQHDLPTLAKVLVTRDVARQMRSIISNTQQWIML